MEAINELIRIFKIKKKETVVKMKAYELAAETQQEENEIKAILIKETIQTYLGETFSNIAEPTKNAIAKEIIEKLARL